MTPAALLVRDVQEQSAVFQALEQKASSELGHDEEGPQALLSWISAMVVGGLALAALALCSFNIGVRFFYPAWTLELSDEVQVYLIIWAVMIALGAATLGDRHVKADLFLSFFPPGVPRLLEIFGDLLGLSFGLLLLWFGGVGAYESYDFGDVSTTSLRFPLWIYVLALPSGALMLSIGHSVRLVRNLSGKH